MLFRFAGYHLLSTIIAVLSMAELAVPGAAGSKLTSPILVI